LLLALPALAALAAFALPTLGRSLSALIDWFTLIFFSGCAFIIWIVWISMQTGFPAQPAANVARLAPGFESSFSGVLFFIAFFASLIWVWLVTWRIGKHRSAIWKSMVLPAGGAALCWLLLMTLWLPLLDFARSYAPLVKQASQTMQTTPVCVEAHQLSRSQIAAFQFHGNLKLMPLNTAICPWLITSTELSQIKDAHAKNWMFIKTLSHPSDMSEELFLYSRTQH
jgi:hypothetical protein